MSFEYADGLRYLFLDFNAYFAAVEQHDDPALFGRPVIVAPSTSEHTSAIAVSYEARKSGIKRGTRIREARQMCPGIAVRTARHDRYVQLHKVLMTLIERHLPVSKIYSIDEAAFRLSPPEFNAPAAIDLARRIRASIAEEVGPALRASFGLAQTRLLAKLAAELHKPDGMTVLEPGEVCTRLADLPLEKIPGIGKGMGTRLARNGVVDFQSLWNLQPKQARKIWNSVQGERFWYSLRGYEVEEAETQRSMFGHSRVLYREHESPGAARIVARALLMKAASRLRHAGFFARRLSLSMRVRPEGRLSGEAGFAPSQDSFLFLHKLDQIWAHLTARHDVARLGGVSVYLHGLSRQGDDAVCQGDLFAPAQNNQVELRRAKLWQLIDEINSDPDGRLAKLGRPEEAAPGNGNTNSRHITLATQKGLALDYLGAKIAFSRVPDEAEFRF
ncbi:MAG: hypothetical protein MRY64_01230 [Hyphomonadaceae bacterium]|nr:hypothetical protein [Hyphomonadaceae bacterium]